jgi:hypothetical protein
MLRFLSRFTDRHAAPRVATKRRLSAALEPLERRALLSGNGLSAAYFNATDLTDLKLSRTDKQISYDWSAAPPAASLGTDYSVRWTGRVQARYTEQYRFVAFTAGMVRLWVNRKLIIDDWAPHALKADSGYINLQSGTKYDLRMEYATTGGQSVARLYEESASQAKVIIPRGDLYSSPFETIAPAAPNVWPIIDFVEETASL